MSAKPRPDHWAPPRQIEDARRGARRTESVAGMTAGLLSFVLVLLLGGPEGSSTRLLVVLAVVVALGACLAVLFQHVRAAPGTAPPEPLGPTARGLLGYARGLALAAALGAALYLLLWGLG